MNTWLLSIAGVVVIGVVIELILTKSTMSKFIRTIYAFFILLVIVAPLPGFLRGNISFGGAFDYDWDLINNIGMQSQIAATNRTIIALEAAGFQNVLITLTAIRDVPNFQIENVFVNATGVVVTNDGNINVRDEIIRIVRAILRVSEQQIIYTF
ncbi:MAG: hypothetical protein FWE01_02575 [Firmicutes bacterium]|nr:hypothetical protein [Bacillota bacterium]